MMERTVPVPNSLGLHARPAAQFVRLANTFASHVEAGKDDAMVNAKSIMGVMMLTAECGSMLRIRANGPDEDQAVTALVELVQGGFGET
jgi:phosphocarrier protein